MIKNYLLLITICFSLIANAQFEQNFDSFSLGDVVGQAPNIVLWPAAGVTSSQVTTEQAFSGTNSMVTREQAGALVDDILINVGNKSGGVWSVQFMVYVPAGKVGFWNIQDDENFGSTADAQWNGQFFIGETASGGAPGVISFDQGKFFAPYPEDTWFSVTHVLDLDNGTHTLDINGTSMLDEFPYLDTDGNLAFQLGAINFYAIDANNRFFVDDFVLFEGNLLLSNDDFSETKFVAYPNPVTNNQLNIRSSESVDKVVIYDILGKEVLNISPNAISPKVDMSRLTSGVYLVNVTINGNSKTIKVIK